MDLEHRVKRLERESKRLKNVGLIIMSLMSTVLLMGVA
jgi:hypothetical protein